MDGHSVGSQGLRALILVLGDQQPGLFLAPSAVTCLPLQVNKLPRGRACACTVVGPQEGTVMYDAFIRSHPWSELYLHYCIRPSTENHRLMDLFCHLAEEITFQRLNFLLC